MHIPHTSYGRTFHGFLIGGVRGAVVLPNRAFLARLGAHTHTRGFVQLVGMYTFREPSAMMNPHQGWSMGISIERVTPRHTISPPGGSPEAPRGMNLDIQCLIFARM